MNAITLNVLGLCVLGLLSASPALGQAATDVKCDGCVQTGDIATNGVRRSDIQNFSINTPKLNNFAVTTAKIKPGAVTADKIADGAITPEKINATDANLNTRYGQAALNSNTEGHSNTANGANALYYNTNGAGNTANGAYALFLNTTGASNSANGAYALHDNTTGVSNSANGAYALRNNTTGNHNTANGTNALWNNTEGGNNTANGAYALFLNTTGVSNSANGAYALRFNTEGDYNTANGLNALNNNTTGNYNTALGNGAGLYHTTGDYNIAIGAGNYGVDGEGYTTRIGTVQTRAFIAGIYGATIGTAINVVIDSAGQLGTVSSSARYKEDIQDMGSSSDRLLQLRPVTFRYKEAYENGEKPLDYGLIAEEVAEVFPELVIYNKQNQPETVKYRLLSTLLLNELQKEHRVNQEQGLEMAELKAQVAELNQLVQQMAKLALPATELVANNTGD